MVNEQTAFENQVGLRFTTVYGDGCREGMLFDRIKHRTLTSITNHIRDFVHVEDVVDAITVFINQGLEGKKAFYDVGTGIGMRVNEIVNDHLNMNVPVNDGLPCEAKNNTCDPRNMQELGWLASKNFMDYVK
jgi:nucleoside-diphosphate-sugar epimerase